MARREETSWPLAQGLLSFVSFRSDADGGIDENHYSGELVNLPLISETHWRGSEPFDVPENQYKFHSDGIIGTLQQLLNQFTEQINVLDQALDATCGEHEVTLQGKPTRRLHCWPIWPVKRMITQTLWHECRL